MEGLKETVSAANEKLSDIEKKRELSISLSRAIIRKTKTVIHGIHVNQYDEKMMVSLKNDMDSLIESFKDDETLHSGPVKDAMMEYSEACIFAAVYEGKKIPSYEDLKITAQTWVLGLADSVGELRRLVLAMLVAGNMEKAKEYFEAMDEISNEVLMFDVPDAISPIRKKQDAIRGIVEKTRSDYANALIFKK